MKLFCEGSSDDTFGVYVVADNGRVREGWDHDNCASGEPIVFRIRSGSVSVLVVGQYAPWPCAGWLIGVAPDDLEEGDEQHIPRWQMHFEQSDREYSPRLVIDAPDDVSVEWVEGKSA